MSLASGTKLAHYEILERGSRTRLTKKQSTARDPAWSPDGTRVAFTHNSQIWVVPADGSSEARVVGRGVQPFFGVDGRTILAFRRNAESHLYEIVSLDAAGESEPRVVLTDSVSVRFPLLSPDGRLLAYDRGDVTRSRTWCSSKIGPPSSSEPVETRRIETSVQRIAYPRKFVNRSVIKEEPTWERQTVSHTMPLALPRCWHVRLS